MSSSYLLIFTPPHLHICTSSLLHIFSSSHLHILTSAHLHICTPPLLDIFSSSHLHMSSSHLPIFASAHPHICTRLPCFLSPTLSFYLLSSGRWGCQRGATKCNPLAGNEVRSAKTDGKNAVLQPPAEPSRTKWGSISKNWSKPAMLQVYVCKKGLCVKAKMPFSSYLAKNIAASDGRPVCKSFCV